MSNVDRVEAGINLAEHLRLAYKTPEGFTVHASHVKPCTVTMGAQRFHAYKVELTLLVLDEELEPRQAPPGWPA